jgi:hypothetical protein
MNRRHPHACVCCRYPVDLRTGGGFAFGCRRVHFRCLSAVDPGVATVKLFGLRVRRSKAKRIQVSAGL